MGAAIFQGNGSSDDGGRTEENSGRDFVEVGWNFDVPTFLFAVEIAYTSYSPTKMCGEL